MCLGFGSVFNASNYYILFLFFFFSSVYSSLSFLSLVVVLFTDWSTEHHLLHALRLWL